jgi:uncharacterized protein YukE
MDTRRNVATQRTIPTKADIQQAWTALQFARYDGDQLKIDLATNVLNDLLDRYRESR